MPQIEWVGTPNYRAGRDGQKPIAIVDHITAGLYPGCLTWMQNPKSQASAHYLVLKNGRILQLVRETDTAWHAGAVNKPNWKLYDGTNPNRYTLGIEHEGFPQDGLTEKQYQSTLWLHQQLVAKWGIPVDSDHIIGHYRIDSVNRPNCPGPKFPWDRLFKDLRGDDMFDKIIFYVDGDVGSALTYSQSKDIPMVRVTEKTLESAFKKFPAKKTFIIGISGESTDERIYITGSNRMDSAKKLFEN